MRVIRYRDFAPKATGRSLVGILEDALLYMYENRFGSGVFKVSQRLLELMDMEPTSEWKDEVAALTLKF